MPDDNPRILGAKAILYIGESLVSILRDDIPSIPWPNYWDLPGGGLEAGETGMDAVRREIREELGLDFAPSDFVWDRVYARRTGGRSHFFAAPIDRARLGTIRFGDEGQHWTLMPRAEFCARADAVPHFRARVGEFFSTRPDTRA